MVTNDYGVVGVGVDSEVVVTNGAGVGGNGGEMAWCLVGGVRWDKEYL